MRNFDDSWLIPVEPGQAVDAGWPAATGGRPHGVTWHWTATWDRAECDRLLGGRNAARRGQASAHYAVGRDGREGVARYVELDNRSWHAGKNQLLRWDGQAFGGDHDKGSRTTVGVETVNIGFAREGVPAGEGWIAADSADGRQRMLVQPWPEEQIAMMAEVGREIRERWPQIGPRDHHGHYDLCPTWKTDPAGFPFAELLRQLYQDPDLPDVWTPTATNSGRREWLRRLGYASHLAVEDPTGGPPTTSPCAASSRPKACRSTASSPPAWPGAPGIGSTGPDLLLGRAGGTPAHPVARRLKPVQMERRSPRPGFFAEREHHQAVDPEGDAGAVGQAGCERGEQVFVERRLPAGRGGGALRGRFRSGAAARRRRRSSWKPLASSMTFGVDLEPSRHPAVRGRPARPAPSAAWLAG